MEILKSYFLQVKSCLFFEFLHHFGCLLEMSLITDEVNLFEHAVAIEWVQKAGF